MNNNTKNNSTGSRRSACLECRQRKVRCLGNDEDSCQNCLRRGSKCVFIANSERDKDELLVMIKELNDRLSQAEKSLGTRTASPVTITPNVEGQGSRKSLDLSETWNPDDGHNDFHLDFTAPEISAWKEMDMAEDLGPGAYMNDTNGMIPENSLDHFDYNMMQAFPVSADIIDSNFSADELSPSLTQNLFRLYFELEDHGCFMLDRECFIATMEASNLGPELLSLKEIVLAHASSSTPAYYLMRTKFYEASRQHFETAETGQSSNTIAALQSCILLAMYELKNMLFTRAYSRVYRALWMAKIFGLSRMDNETPTTGPQSRLPRSALAATTDYAELEERRRTFWSAFILGCFISTSAGWDAHPLVDKAEFHVTTLLPALDPWTKQRLDLTSILHVSVWGPTVKELSSFQALVISSALYRRCLGHADSALGRLDGETCMLYDFWMNHHHISEDVTAFASIIRRQKNVDPAISIRTEAVVLCLNYAVVVHQSRVTSAVTSPGAPRDEKCVKAATEVMRLVEQIKRDSNPFAVSLYVLWSIYVVAQYYVRKLHDVPRCHRSSADVTTMAVDPALSRLVGSSSGSYLTADSVRAESIQRGRPELHGYISNLLDMLTSFANANPIARAFESQIRCELNGGKDVTDARPVGQVEFLLGVEHVF